jgi:hypothetical protein
MLSADMIRYVELHRTVGFKFRTQHQMLASFVIFAEQHGDEFVRVDRALEWAARAPSAAQRCKLLLEVRRPMLWAGHPTDDGSSISTRLMRFPGLSKRPPDWDPPARSDRGCMPRYSVFSPQLVCESPRPWRCRSRT